VAAIGGLAYAYKYFTDEKYDPRQPLNWVQDQIGWSKDQPAEETKKGETGGLKSKIASDNQYLFKYL